MASRLGFEVTLDVPHEEAIERVTDALKAEGFGVLTRVDVHRALKEKIGVDFRPYAILGACNPPLAHRALSHRAEVGLMLPCNVTVEALEENRCLVRIGDPDAMMGVGELARDSTLMEVAREARERLVRAAKTLRG